MQKSLVCLPSCMKGNWLILLMSLSGCRCVNTSVLILCQLGQTIKIKKNADVATRSTKTGLNGTPASVEFASFLLVVDFIWNYLKCRQCWKENLKPKSSCCFIFPSGCVSEIAASPEWMLQTLSFSRFADPSSVHSLQLGSEFF